MGKATICLAGAHLRHYELVGRHRPTPQEPQPKLFRHTCFAPNHVAAKTKFWKFMRECHKVKRANGELFGVRELKERAPNTVKNFCVHLRWFSRTGPVNTSKEIRDTHLSRGVSRIFNGLAGQHRASFSNIQVIRSSTKLAKQCALPHMTQFHNGSIRFPLIHRVRKPAAAKRAVLTAKAPQTF
ncbi:60S ribosomal protein L18a-2 [Diplonema papillatum]|nr:60S ribosomal protein L18a-2 [Diplonema papillatum]|eukprot:gene6418-9820_t